MKNTVDRVIPLWENQIQRKIADNKRVIVVSHKNTMRAMFGYLQGSDEENIKKMQIANALPIVYEFDQNMQYINNYILLD